MAINIPVLCILILISICYNLITEREGKQNPPDERKGLHEESENHLHL